MVKSWERCLLLVYVSHDGKCIDYLFVF
jgi:hypothetical protein